MARHLEPDPTYPLVLVGEIVAVAFNGSGGSRIDLVVAHKWPRLRARPAAPSTPGGRTTPVLPEVVWQQTLYKTTLTGETRATFMAYLAKPEALKGQKVVLAGVPAGGLDMQDEHYIQVFHAAAFLPTRAWLAAFEAAVTPPVGARA